MTELNPSDDLTPQQHVEVIQQEYFKGEPYLFLILNSEDRDLIDRKLDPYARIELSFADLVVWKKPIGMEFRTKQDNINAFDASDAEEKVLEALPDFVNEVNIVYSGGKTSKKAVVTVPYKDEYKDNIGLFTGSDTIERIRVENGTDADIEKVSNHGSDLKDYVEKALKKPVYEVNEMTHGSLTYKTRESGWKDGSNRVDRPGWDRKD